MWIWVGFDTVKSLRSLHIFIVVKKLWLCWFVKSSILICSNKMKRVHYVDEDVSSSDKPDPKRFMSDNSGSTKRRLKLKLINVMVLFHRDVRKENGRVHLLKGKLGQLRKPERGQYKTKIPITTDMTKTIVEKQLRLQFPIVGDKGR